MSDKRKLEKEENITYASSESVVKINDGENTTKEKKQNVKVKKNGKKAGKIIKWFVILLMLAGICAFVWFNPAAYSFAQKYISFLPERNTVVKSTSNYTQVPVERRTISVTLTGTGTLQPIDSYTITSKVTGEIMVADFEEMDQVEEEQVLYVIDSSDLERDIRDFADSVEDAREALEDIEEEYDDLVLYSDYSGVVEKLYVEEEDTVQKGTKIAHIIDRDTMLLEVPFFVQDIDNIRVGQTAQITVNASTDSVSGTVTEIGKSETVTAVGAKLRTVIISVKNPGGITISTTAYASVDGVESAQQGIFKYSVDEELTAIYGGEIEVLSIEEGDRISEGSLILRISSEVLDDQKEKLEDSLEKAQDSYNDYVEKLEDYTIKAPISGTVVQKNYKVSDNLSTGSNGNSAMAIIYDMTKLNFDMSIDEIDLSLIKEGQEVKITSDSFDETYTGYVKKKSIIGSSSMGTTSYPVTIELDGNDVLLPGMNVNATIYIEKVEDVLAVPVEAIMRGDKVRVLKSSSSYDVASNVATDIPQTGTDIIPQMPEGVEKSANGEITRFNEGEIPPMHDGEIPQMNGERPQRAQGGRQQSGNITNITDDDFEIVDVVTGVSDDEYVEIVSGLEDGDIVVIQNNTVDSSATVTGMPGFGGIGGGMTMGGGFGGNMGGEMSARPANMGGRIPG